MNKKEKNYKNHADNMKKRRTLKKQGYTNIKIKDGEIISKKHKNELTDEEWEEYQRDSQADAEEPEDYRCYEYEPWR